MSLSCEPRVERAPRSDRSRVRVRRCACPRCPVCSVIGNFGTVFVDQSYWQSAVAAKPGAAHKGYILGGMVWFTIPFALATALGLAGNALNVALTSGDAGSGLVPPAAAIALFGKPGGILVMIQLTMAIVSALLPRPSRGPTSARKPSTHASHAVVCVQHSLYSACRASAVWSQLSTGSAECIAVSSLMSYDVYRTYINPAATGSQILFVSRVFVFVWAIVMGVASVILYEMKIGLGCACLRATGHRLRTERSLRQLVCLAPSRLLDRRALVRVAGVYNFMAIALGSAVCPIACSIYTDKLNATFAILAAVVGNVCAVVVWISYASTIDADGDFVNNSLGYLYSQLWGGLTALVSSFLICVFGCVVAPSNFDWKIMSEGIKLVGGDGGEESKVLGDVDEESTPEALLKVSCHCHRPNRDALPSWQRAITATALTDAHTLPAAGEGLDIQVRLGLLALSLRRVAARVRAPRRLRQVYLSVVGCHRGNVGLVRCHGSPSAYPPHASPHCIRALFSPTALHCVLCCRCAGLTIVIMPIWESMDGVMQVLTCKMPSTEPIEVRSKTGEEESAQA
jgi:hypothetical protein